MQFAAAAGFAGALACAATTSPSAQIRAERAASVQVSQYCTPQQEEPWDTQAHRVYCHDDRG